MLLERVDVRNTDRVKLLIIWRQLSWIQVKLRDELFLRQSLLLKVDFSSHLS